MVTIDKKEKSLLSFMILVFSGCSMIYELALSYMISIIYGNTVVIYSMVIGLYMFFLGLGSFFYSKISEKILDKFLIVTEFLLTLTAFFSPLIIVMASIVFENYEMQLTISFIPVILIGLFSGFELPILIGIYEKNFSKVIFLDYIGGLLGTIFFIFVLLDNFDILQIFIITGILNILMIILYSLIKKEKKAFVFFLLYLFFYAGIGLSYQDQYVKNLYYQKRLEIRMLKQFPTKGNHPIIKIKHAFNTKYQEVIDANITVFNNQNIPYNFECIFLNRQKQYCSDWYKYYHFFLTYVPVSFFQPKRKLNVLILGGGDLIAANFLSKIPNVEHIDLIDIDKKFVKFEEKYQSKYNGKVYKNKKLSIYYDDAFHRINLLNKKYDIIIDDLPVITNINLLKLGSIEFFRKIYESLKSDGVFAIMFDEKSLQKEINNISCSGFSNMLLLKTGFPINKFVTYDDIFFYFRKNKKSFKILNTKLIPEKFLPFIYSHGTEYKLKCNKNMRLNTIFKPDMSLIIKPIY